MSRLVRVHGSPMGLIKFNGSGAEGTDGESFPKQGLTKQIRVVINIAQ